jgi:4-hydroxy-L-threonine phosphate dehydrogenase PdxA
MADTMEKVENWQATKAALLDFHSIFLSRTSKREAPFFVTVDQYEMQRLTDVLLDAAIALEEAKKAADEIERLSEHINQLQAKLHCMCGSAIDHSPWDGHQPVSMFDHAVEQEVERRMQALVTREIAPHNYVPSAMHMGDCNVCGNLRDHPIHKEDS